MGDCPRRVQHAPRFLQLDLLDPIRREYGDTPSLQSGIHETPPWYSCRMLCQSYRRMSAVRSAALPIDRSTDLPSSLCLSCLSTLTPFCAPASTTPSVATRSLARCYSTARWASVSSDLPC